MDTNLSRSASVAPHAQTPTDRSPVPTAGLVSPFSTLISLVDVQAAGTRLEWDEVVAIAQELCGVLAAPGRQSVLKPIATVTPLGLDDVFIDATGHVSIAAHGPGSETRDVQCVGNVLSRMSPPNDPLFFRTRVVAKAISTPPGYASVDEVARALAPISTPIRCR